ncbi:hypothetical protein CK203_045784 [Vitis vinifera]|uniref:Uncharacterized protein n=1 Tax=Vitis vinifera TaxID=29760 RepID=A0A438I123_VITVI|nr:hypothetical protein CK203_045784 [Vitis vinifera]
MHPHIYLILPEQIPYEESICHVCGPSTNSTSESSYKESQDFRARRVLQSTSGFTVSAFFRQAPRPSLPIEGNSDCRSRDFHVEAYFDHSLMRQQPELRDSYRLLERYHLIPFMTLPQFFYPRVALDFYQSMTTRGVPVPASILFTIDGRQGILGARQIADASISLLHQQIPLHLDAGPHFLSGTWFVSYLEGHLPRGPF